MTGVLLAATLVAKFALSFADEFNAVEKSNFRDRVTFALETFKDERGLSVRAADPSADPKSKEADTAWKVTSKTFRVHPGSAWAVRVRSAGNLNMMMNYGGTHIAWLDDDEKPVQTIDPRGEPVALRSGFGFRANTNRWTETVTRGIVPKGAHYARLAFGGDNPNVTGASTILLSRAEYFEGRSDKELVFTGDFDAPVVSAVRPARPCSDLKSPIAFELKDAGTIPRESVRFELDGTNMTARLKKKKKADIYYYVPEKPWEDGSVHTFVISASDEQGNEMREDRLAYFTTENPVHPRYAVRPDGVVLKDGKPIFPVSIFACGGSSLDDCAKELKKNGFDHASVYLYREHHRTTIERFWQACEDHGLGFVMQPCRANDYRADRDAVVTDNVLAGRKAKCMFGWELGDDTASHRTPYEVRREHHRIHALDADILTTQSDTAKHLGRYREFADATDVFKVEIYPHREYVAQPHEMAEYRAFMENAWKDLELSGAKNRSIWAIPQVFEGWTNWKRYPSFEEVRCGTFVTIANRARGLAYYTYRSGEWGARTDEKHWAELCKVTRAVRALEPDLASADAEKQPVVTVVDGPEKDALGQFSVSFLLKETGLLIAANTAPAEVEAKFKMPDGQTISHRFPRFGVLVRRTQKR